MVGCTLFTFPPPCRSLGNDGWWVPSIPPFKLGPFTKEASPDPNWGTNWLSTSKIPVDVEVYSLILLICDVLLTLAWHYATKYVVVVTRGQFRLKFLSPSVRFTLGLLFGASRLWAIGYIRPTVIYHILSRLCFFVYLLLGLTALAFDDGPWRTIRPNRRSVLNRDSILNPYATINKALSVTKLTLARPVLRRTLEAGNLVTIVLDKSGSLLYAKRGSIDIRQAVQFKEAGQRSIIELVARQVSCKSGSRIFFGFVFGGPFEKFGVQKLTKLQQASLLELLVYLNDCKSLLSSEDGITLPRAQVKWFQIPLHVGFELKQQVQEKDVEEEPTRLSVLSLYEKY